MGQANCEWACVLSLSHISLCPPHLCTRAAEKELRRLDEARASRHCCVGSENKERQGQVVHFSILQGSQPVGCLGCLFPTHVDTATTPVELLTAALLCLLRSPSGNGPSLTGLMRSCRHPED
eukprot:365346-Chlamydomonas_euryale.AAC.10